MQIFIILLITGLHLFLWGRNKKVVEINQRILAANQEIILKFINERTQTINQLRPDFNKLSTLQKQSEEFGPN